MQCYSGTHEHGRKEGRKEGREGGREGGRKEGMKEGRKAGRKEGRKEIFILASIHVQYYDIYNTILSAWETITKTAMRSLS